MIPLRPAAVAVSTAAALLIAAAIAQAQGSLPAPAAAEAVLTFREPAEGAALVGEVRIAVRLTPADLAGVELVLTTAASCARCSSRLGRAPGMRAARCASITCARSRR